MKKQYQQPSMTAVELQDICNSLLISSDAALDGTSLVRGIEDNFDNSWDKDE